MSFRATIVAAGLATALSSFGTEPARAQPVGDGAQLARASTEAVQGLARFFEVVVFDAEFRQPRHQEVISRWESPVSIALKGRDAKVYRSMVVRHGRSLSRLTGLKIKVLDPGQDSGNVTVRFVRRHAMDKVGIDRVDPSLKRRLAASGGCFFVSFRDSNGRIHRSDIVVNVERPSQAIDHCLLEELTQSLGLPNDSNLIRPSIFSDKAYPSGSGRINGWWPRCYARSGATRLRPRQSALSRPTTRSPTDNCVAPHIALPDAEG